MKTLREKEIRILARRLNQRRSKCTKNFCWFTATISD